MIGTVGFSLCPIRATLAHSACSGTCEIEQFANGTKCENVSENRKVGGLRKGAKKMDLYQEFKKTIHPLVPKSELWKGHQETLDYNEMSREPGEEDRFPVLADGALLGHEASR